MSRRHLLKLLASAMGIGPILIACSGAAESTSSTAPSLPAESAPPATTSTTEPTNTDRSSAPPPEPEILEVIGREGWSIRPQGEFRPHTIERITIHHTAAEIQDNSRAPALLRQHEDWHMSHGWPDLAYHFMVDRNGNIYEGRPFDAIGDTFTEYDPTGHFLACFEGHFDLQEPSQNQLAAMNRLVGWAMQRFDVPAELIGGHRDWAATTCPGDNMYWRLPGLVRAAADRPETLITYLRDDAARSRVEAIGNGA
jgi:hypothetical protein